MQFSALQEAYQCKGKVACCENGKPFKHCQLVSGVTHSSSVSTAVTKTLSPLPFGRYLHLPGLLCQVGQVKSSWCGQGQWRKGSVVIKREETKTDKSILKDEKESVAKENENWKVRLEKMKTRKWTEMLWKVDRQEGETGVYGMSSTPHMRNNKPKIWKLLKEKNLKICVTFDWVKLCLLWILQSAHTFSEYVPWVTFFPLWGLGVMEIHLKLVENFRKCVCFCISF